MYGGYAEHERYMEIMRKARERVKNDPEYRQQVIDKLGLEKLFSQMTEEHWEIADRRYGVSDKKS
ncbi:MULTISPECIES: hypothetical protein [Chitinophaga]|uniref:hypothetical protein n=1 Tax=Chitinophaga TaxID=79328 RepID=UPI0009C71318|nr:MULTISPECIES: hypothetical protein [Chitinophaga]OMP74941.1 hypothetical protein BW716_32665 [[Flexibacter] sp. ATCC 35208]WPQ65168.1 hypothetical protein SIO70_09960 [Chitinophaga sancti]WPV69629.1 hypothetical protein QQL36_13070 [Chitinophaga sp. LS1]